MTFRKVASHTPMAKMSNREQLGDSGGGGGGDGSGGGGSSSKEVST